MKSFLDYKINYSRIIKTIDHFRLSNFYPAENAVMELKYDYLSNRCSDIIRDYDEEYKQSIEELWDEQGRNEDKTYEKQDS